MFFLLIAIACYATVAMLFKLGGVLKCNSAAITTFNYIAASVSALIMVALSGQPFFLWVEHPWQALVGNLSGNITYEGSFVLAVLFGCGTGIIYLISFMSYQKAIKECGASIASMFLRLGILLPMIVSIFAWNEIPGIVQWIGIILAIGSIIVVNIDTSGKAKFSFRISLILSFIFGGAGQFMNKIYQKYAVPEFKNHFTFCIFLVAMLLSLVVLYYNKDQGVHIKDALVGVGVGIPNMFSVFFILLALGQLPATIVYPTSSAGSIMAIMVCSYLFFGEKLQKKEKVGILLTVISMVLINL